MLIAGLICQLCFSATFFGIPAASALFQSSFHFAESELAMFLGAAALGVVCTEVFWGVATDRFGERRVLLLGATMSALLLGYIAFAFTPRTGYVPNVWALAALLFLASAFSGAVTGPSGRAILGWFGSRRHGTLLSLRLAAVPVGGAIGAALLEPVLRSGGAAAAFLLMSCLCGVATAIAALLLFDPVSSSIRTTRRQSPLRRWAVWRIAVSGFALDLTQLFLLAFGARMLSSVNAVPLSVGLGVVVAMQIGGGAARVVTGMASDRFPRLSRPSIVRGLCLAQVIALLLVAVWRSLPEPLLVSLLLAAGVASCAWQGLHFAEIAHVAGPTGAGSALGLNNTMTSLGAFTAQVAVLLTLDALGWTWSLALFAIIPAMAGFFLFPGRTSSTKHLLSTVRTVV